MLSIFIALCCAGVQLLATASRDRLVHIFDIDHDYGLVQTLDDHSSAITAVRFTELDSQLMMLSCGADKSLLFRNAQLVCYTCQFLVHWICLACLKITFVAVCKYKSRLNEIVMFLVQTSGNVCWSPF